MRIFEHILRSSSGKRMRVREKEKGHQDWEEEEGYKEGKREEEEPEQRENESQVRSAETQIKRGLSSK